MNESIKPMCYGSTDMKDSLQAMLEREGETLDFRKLLPKTPPDAENLLAIEPLRGITEAVNHDEAKGEPGANRKVLADMKLKSVAPHSRGVETGRIPGV